jgi:hypothetical protein
MEDPTRLEICGEAIAALAGKDLDALRETCGSDITVAPLNVEMREVGFSRPISQFVVASMLGITMRQADASPREVAVVVIHQPIETSMGIVERGEYRMDYWFDANGIFFAATISGAAIDENGNETEVVNQQVPAVPATFVNEDGSAQAGAQISACRIFGRCSFFQKTCP